MRDKIRGTFRFGNNAEAWAKFHTKREFFKSFAKLVKTYFSNDLFTASRVDCNQQF